MTKYLLVGPHPDDVELGCLVGVMSIVEAGDEVTYLIMSDCTDIPRNRNIIEEIKKVDEKLSAIFSALGVAFETILYKFTNRRLREEHMEIRKRLEKIRNSFNPYTIFAPSPRDLHQDHSYIGEEVLRVFKNKTILNYEIPQATQDFNPNYFIVVDELMVEIVADILTIYKSQKRQNYMRKELMIGTLRHRGRTIGKDYAQAFEVRRMVSDVD